MSGVVIYVSARASGPMAIFRLWRTTGSDNERTRYQMARMASNRHIIRTAVLPTLCAVTLAYYGCNPRATTASPPVATPAEPAIDSSCALCGTWATRDEGQAMVWCFADKRVWLCGTGETDSIECAMGAWGWHESGKFVLAYFGRDMLGFVPIRRGADTLLLAADTAAGADRQTLVRCGVDTTDSLVTAVCARVDSFHTVYAHKLEQHRGALDSCPYVIVRPRYDCLLDLGAANGCIPVNVGAKKETWGRSLSGGAWGLIDTNGTEILPPVYDEVRAPLEGMIAVRKDGRWGFHDTTGNVRIDYAFSFVGNFNDGLAPVNSGGEGEGPAPWGLRHIKGGIWGFVDTAGTLVYDTVFDHVGYFYRGLARVSRDSAWGIVDATGDTVVPFDYAVIRPYSEGRYLCNRGGTTVDTFDVYGQPFTTALGGAWEYLDSTGAIVGAGGYEDARGFAMGCACVKKHGRWGVIDIAGEQVADFRYDAIWSFRRTGLATVLEDSAYGVIDTAGKLILDTKYDGIHLGWFDGRAIRIEDSSGYGIASNAGEILLPCRYRDIFGADSSDLYQFEDTSGLWGFGSLANGVLCKPIYHRQVRLVGPERIAVYEDGKYALVDCEAEPVTEPLFDVVRDFSEGLAAVRMGDSWGYIDTRGRLRIPCRYDEAKAFSAGLAAVRIHEDSTGAHPHDARWGYVDTEGDVVIAPQFYRASAFQGDCAQIETKVKGEWYHGYVDRDGEWLVEPMDAYFSSYDGCPVLGRFWILETAGKQGLLRIPCRPES